MPNLIIDLEVDRVDLVDEGANSEAFIKMYKRKENIEPMDFEEILKAMKPEHAQVTRDEVAKALAVVPSEAAEELAKTKADLVALTGELQEVKKQAGASAAEPTVEDIVKGLDPAVQQIFKSLEAQKNAAEVVAKQLLDQKINDEAVSKAAELKAIPVDQDKLIAVLKSATPEVLEVLAAANGAIANGEIFQEIGKNTPNGASIDAWTKIEKKAEEVAKRDNVTKQKAIAIATKENPELYKEYLKGGAN